MYSAMHLQQMMADNLHRGRGVAGCNKGGDVERNRGVNERRKGGGSNGGCSCYHQKDDERKGLASDGERRDG